MKKYGRRIVCDMSHIPKERKTAHWALSLLQASEVGEAP